MKLTRAPNRSLAILLDAFPEPLLQSRLVDHIEKAEQEAHLYATGRASGLASVRQRDAAILRDLYTKLKD
jgi:hypothetical protein